MQMAASPLGLKSHLIVAFRFAFPYEGVLANLFVAFATLLGVRIWLARVTPPPRLRVILRGNAHTLRLDLGYYDVPPSV